MTNLKPLIVIGWAIVALGTPLLVLGIIWIVRHSDSGRSYQVTKDFWERCVKAGCVIVPVKVYSGYVNGDLDESTCLGIRYAALEFGDVAVAPEYWFMIDESSSGSENLHETPIAALETFET